MKSTRSLIVAVAIVLAVLLYLSATGKKPPFIPRDIVHRTLTTQEACVACHLAGKQSPLKPSHPPKEQCLICHKVAKS